jgi:hypothetical protein
MSETFNDGTTYERFDTETFNKLTEMRINGHGRIVTVCDPVGENHPSYVETADGATFQLSELKMPYVEFDGRHTDLPF